MPRSPNRDDDRTIAGSQSEKADPRIAAAIDAYLKELQAGHAPLRDSFLARYPEIADQLAGHLEGLDLLHPVAPGVAAAAEPAGQDSASREPVGHEPVGHEPEVVSPSAKLGDFRLIRQLGCGGMGVVYEAEQVSLGRRVAVKVLPFAAMLDEHQRKRFQNEARTAATLDHPHIVPVHFVGQERGVHFYAMHLIDGQSMAELIAGLRKNPSHPSPSASQSQGTGEPVDDGNRTPDNPGDDPPGKFAVQLTAACADRPAEFFRIAARLAAEAAEALGHAHRLGVLHRDIKPGNLLIDHGGKLWVTDFGLASIEAAESLTRSGSIVGTPAYMSPEQALDSHRIDGRADVYSLGASLYELLTLRSHRLGTLSPIAGRAAVTGVGKPGRGAPPLPADLETIVTKALQYAARDRYQTADEMAADLRAFLDGREIKARRLTLWQRQTRFLRRHRRWTAAAALSSFLLVVAFGALMWGYSRRLGRYAEQLQAALADAEEARGVAEEQALLARQRLADAERSRAVAESSQQKAEESELFARGLYYRSDLQSAYEHFENENRFDAARLVDRQAPIDGKHDLRGIEWRLLKTELDAKSACLGRHGGAATECESLPDGRRAVSAGEDGLVHLWDTTARCKLRTFEPAIGPIHAVAVSPDGSLIAVGGNPSPATFGYAMVQLLEVDSGRSVGLLQRHPTTIETIEFSPDGTLIAAGCRYEQVQLSTLQGELRHTWEASGRNDSIAFSPDSGSLLAAAEKRKLVVWDCQNGAVILGSTDWENVRRSVAAVGWAGAGGYFAAAAKASAEIDAFDARTGKRWSTTAFQHAKPRAITVFHISPEGATITAGDTEGRVHRWQADVGQWQDHRAGDARHPMTPTMAPIKVDGQAVSGVVCLDDGSILSTHQSGRVMLSDPHRSAARVHRFEFDVIAAAAGGDTVFLGSRDGTVRSYRANQGRPEVIMSGGERELSELAVDRQCTTLATVDPTGRIEMYDLASRSLRWTQPGQFGPAEGDFRIALSDDGGRLARVGEDRQLVVWDTRRDTVLLRTRFPSRGRCVALTGSGRFVAHGAEGVQIYDVVSGDLVHETRGHSVRAVAFSSDGTQVAIGHREGRVGLYDFQTARDVIMRGHDGPVGSVCYCPEDRTLISAQYGAVRNPIRLWDAAAAEPFGAVETPLTPGQQIGLLTYRVFVVGRQVIVCSVGVAPAELAIWQLESDP